MNHPANTNSATRLPAPPKLAPATGGNPLCLAAIAFAAVVGTAILFLFNPAGHAFYPQCLFHRATGLNCPGCGGLRAAHQLLHGHLLAALQLNVLAVVSLPLFAGFIWTEFAGRRRGVRRRHLISARSAWCFVGLLVVFTVLRNLPAFAFLAP